MEWQTIKTAPNNPGKRFLVTKDCGKGTLASVSLAYRLGDEWYFDAASNRSLRDYGYRATHWMDCPAPPKATE